MYTYSARTIPTHIRRSVLQAIAIVIIATFLLSFVYGFVPHYQQ
ncbi:hypothetical protein [Psychrobacter urativorans]|nr:hypothetical protein [Psychrobacter urativorans]